MLQAVIMAGGSGTRFWPLSREKLPKQFLNLFGKRSLLQQAYDRIQGLVGPDGVLIVTNQQQVAQTREQLPELTGNRIIGEPCGRDTAPCIALAAALLVKQNPNVHMIVLAADHLIQPTEAFHRAVRTADQFLEQQPDALITFGIPPSYASTGYGYLRRDETVSSSDGISVHRLRSFHEKPNEHKAKEFIESGDYYWNSGIFCWRAQTILNEVQRCKPQLHEAVLRIAEAWGGSEQGAVFEREYAAVQKISIDYAVMEQAKSVFMVDVPFEWDDVGSWMALDRVKPSDENQNVVIGRHKGLDTEHCVIVGNDDHLISTLGVKDLIIVHTPDVTLVAHQKDEQAVKQMIEKLKQEGLQGYL